MSEINKSGMSRAAQNKRKKLNKTSNHPKTSSKLTFSNDNSFSDDNDDSSADEKPIKKRNYLETTKKADVKFEDVLMKKIGNVRKLDFDSTTIADILKLKEVVEIGSDERASLLLAKIVHPTSLFEFYSNHWQKAPLFHERGNKTYFKTTFTKKHLTQIFSNQLLFEGNDVQFSDSRGVVKCNNSDGDADDESVSEDAAPVEISEIDITRSLAKGLTVCCHAPQKYNDSLWKFLSALEHEFGCAVGASVHLSPINSVCNERQHDASESFVLQLEGSSRWNLYEPIKGQELPRGAGVFTSDPDDEIGGGAIKSNKNEQLPNVQVTLRTGDSLYIPRGWTYVQHNDSVDLQSLSLKLFPNLGGNCVADLLDLLMPQALAEAAQSSVLFRQSLPSDYRSFLGVSVSEDEDQARRREAFQSHVQQLLSRVVEAAVDVLDPAADQLAKRFMMERLPVPLTKEEEAVSSSGGGNIVINPYTKLRMARPGVAIVLIEEGKVVVYHCMDNSRYGISLYVFSIDLMVRLYFFSREQFGSPLQPLEFELDDGPTIEMLLRAYPEGVMVSDLEHPGEELDDKLSIAEALFKEGFLLVDDEASKPVAEGADNDDDPF
jgi:hypothetical protein